MKTTDSEQIEQCDCVCVHQEIVDYVTADMPDEEELYDLAELFKIFGDTTRIKILYVLFEKEMCVCGVFSAVISQYDAHPFVSTHMSTLFQVYTFFLSKFPWEWCNCPCTYFQ